VDRLLIAPLLRKSLGDVSVVFAAYRTRCVGDARNATDVAVVAY
jgi:hypothetical protein